MDKELFFNRMASYNNAIFPIQILAYLLAMYVVWSFFNSSARSGKLTTAFLGFIWIWNGVIQQFIFFSQYHPQYFFWGVVWTLQGVYFLWYGLTNRLNYQFKNNFSSYVSMAAIIYALIIYPFIGYLAGHPYPKSPIFGVAPCPTVIFTFGSLLLIQKRLSMRLLYFPLLWAIMSLYPVIKMGVLADIGETIIGIVSFWIIWRRNKRLIISNTPI